MRSRSFRSSSGTRGRRRSSGSSATSAMPSSRRTSCASGRRSMAGSAGAQGRPASTGSRPTRRAAALPGSTLVVAGRLDSGLRGGHPPARPPSSRPTRGAPRQRPRIPPRAARPPARTPRRVARPHRASPAAADWHREAREHDNSTCSRLRSATPTRGRGPNRRTSHGWPPCGCDVPKVWGISGRAGKPAAFTSARLQRRPALKAAAL